MKREPVTYVKPIHGDVRIRQILLIYEKSTHVRGRQNYLVLFYSKVIIMLFLSYRGHLFIQTVQLTVGDKQLLTILSMTTIHLHSNRTFALASSRLDAVSWYGGPAGTNTVFSSQA